MAKRIIELIKELENLKKKELNFKFLKDFKCNTIEEFEIFKAENAVAFNELKILKSRIRKIEIELMTDKKKEQYQKYLNDLKEKFKEEE